MTIECIDPEAFDIDVADYTPVIDPDVFDDNSSDPSCYDKAGSLGWILCPIIEQVSDAIQSIYEDYIVPFLKLEPQLFDQSSGTFEAWKQFRDIANVLFIILFLFVIFSQLTGIGIDNYGIKKILPKLIVGAILINLSFIICQLCVDLANVAGYSIGNLFENISHDITTFDMSAINIEGGTTPARLTAVTNILVALVAAVSVGAVLAMGPSVLIPVFMALLSVVIAILFCFALLAVRKAFAVILVAISPLAFVCYMLPNTKKLFDKWFNTFKGVLMAFPICSAMIYGGQMVARIIIAATGGSNIELPIALSAAAISIVPIFMIPKAIQTSMGAIAGGLVAMQGRLNGRARGGIARSGFAQDMQRRNQMRKAGIKFDKNGNARYTPRGHLQNLTRRTQGSKQRLDMARRQAALGQAQMGQAGLMSGVGGLQRMTNMQQAAIAGQAEQDVRDIEASIGMSSEIDNNDVLSDGLYRAMMSGDANRMKAYQNILYGKGEDGRDAARAAVSKAQANGASADIIQAYGSNAMNKWAKDLKGNARSDFEFVKAAAAGSTSESVDSYKAIDKAHKYTAENMASMDDSQIKSMISSMDDEHVSKEQKAYAQQAAYEALHNDNISLKGERRADLEKLAADYIPAEQSNSPTDSDATAGGGGETPAPSPTPNPEPKPEPVHKIETNNGTININHGDRRGEFKTDSGIILSGGTVDNMKRNGK